jgi:hypothetical protein
MLSGSVAAGVVLAEADSLPLTESATVADARGDRVDDSLGAPTALGSVEGEADALPSADAPPLTLEKRVGETIGEPDGIIEVDACALTVGVSDTEALGQAVADADARAVDDGALPVGCVERVGE